MSRKQATFGQLVDYMEDGRQDRRFTLKYNLYSNNPEEIKNEFEKNASFFNKRKNSVYMYHEVISITKSKQLTDEQQKEILRKIVFEYIQKRSENNLVYGVLHDDKDDNFHYHLLISSNELEASKKHRLSKAEFDKIKKDLEIMVLEKYPELQQGVVINKPSNEKISDKEYQGKKRTGKISKRDSVKTRLKTVFDDSKDKSSFFENMEKESLDIYVRGETVGVVDKKTGRKHRLKTLGMLESFTKVSDIIKRSESINNEGSDKEEEVKYNSKAYKEKVKVKNNTYSKTEEISEIQKEIKRRKKEFEESRKEKTPEEYSKTRNRWNEVRWKIVSILEMFNGFFKKININLVKNEEDIEKIDTIFDDNLQKEIYKRKQKFRESRSDNAKDNSFNKNF